MSQFRLRAVVPAMVATASAISLSPDARAADDAAAAGIEEVIVTAQRREETEQKTSLAVSVVSGEELRSAGAVQVRDLSALVPGVQVGQGGAVTQIYIRGVGDFSATPITNPAVAFNLDGVYITRPQAVEGNLYDIARVEVLKGPQGTLYGRNASGGAINVITARPILGSFSGYAAVDAGDYHRAGIETAINIPLGEQLAMRASFQQVTRSGYTSDGSDDDHHQAGRLQLLWQGDAASLLLGGDYAHVGGIGSTGVILSPKAQGITSAWTSSTDPRQMSSFYAAAAAQGLCIPSVFFPTVNNPGQCPALAPYPPIPGLPPAGPYTSLVQFPTNPINQDNRFWGTHAQLDWNLGATVLTVLPSYRSANMDYNLLPSGLSYATPQDSHATTLEARLASNAAATTHWVFGLYHLNETQTSHDEISGGLVQNNHTPSDQTTRSNAAFGQLTLPVTEALRLIAGARYTQDHKSIDGSVTAHYPSVAYLPLSPSGIACAALVPNPCLLETFSGARDFSKVTWKAGIEYDLAPEHLVYATASTGYKSGGFNQAATATPGSTEASSFDPESLTAYALGSKNRFLDNRLQLNLEAFHWDYKNHQEPHITLDGQGQIAFAYENAGTATINGVDFDVVYQPSSADTLHVGAEYLHTRFDTFAYDVPPNAAGLPFARGAGNGFTSFDPFSPLAANTACQTSAITGGALAGGVHVNCSGFELTHAPKWSGSFGIEHRIGLSDRDRILLAAEAQFASQRWLAIDFLPSERAPGYLSANASVTFDHAGRWSLAAYCRNISDKAIYMTGFQNPFVAGYVSGAIAAPRTYGARLSVNF